MRDLVERARHGDLDAFSQLVKASAPRLKGVANLILRDATRAEDALQDALLLAWRDVRGLRDPDAWDAWLRRLTVRACYKVAKKERRRHQVELNVTPEPAGSHTPDTSADVAEREWVLSELDRLDIDRRTVIVLRTNSHLAVGSPTIRVAAMLAATFLLHWYSRRLQSPASDYWQPDPSSSRLTAVATTPPSARPWWPPRTATR